MMARSKRSNQRPDTLMQDRRRQFDEIFLQRTAGPYIGSLGDIDGHKPMSALPPKADVGRRHREVRFVPTTDTAFAFPVAFFFTG